MCLGGQEVGKCKFFKWHENIQFSNWLKPVPGNDLKACHSICKKCFKLGSVGDKAEEFDIQGEKHKICVRYWQIISRTPLTTTLTQFLSTFSQLQACENILMWTRQNCLHDQVWFGSVNIMFLCSLPQHYLEELGKKKALPQTGTDLENCF